MADVALSMWQFVKLVFILCILLGRFDLTNESTHASATARRAFAEVSGGKYAITGNAPVEMRILFSDKLQRIVVDAHNSDLVRVEPTTLELPFRIVSSNGQKSDRVTNSNRLDNIRNRIIALREDEKALDAEYQNIDSALEHMCINAQTVCCVDSNQGRVTPVTSQIDSGRESPESSSRTTINETGDIAMSSAVDCSERENSMDTIRGSSDNDNSSINTNGRKLNSAARRMIEKRSRTFSSLREAFSRKEREGRSSMTAEHLPRG